MIPKYLTPLRSSIKCDILLNLLKESKKLADLRTELQKRSTTILHAMKDLENLSLIKKIDNVYSLTPLGEMNAHIVDSVIQTAETVDRFKDFWLQHDITAIPPKLMQDIGALKDSTLVQNDYLNLNKVHESFLERLGAANEIKGISPILHPDYISTVKEVLTKGASVKIIFTEQVLNRILTLASPKEFIMDLEGTELQIFLRDNLRVALSVTDNTLSLGFFTLNGKYDYNMDIMSDSREAIEWGEKLFQHYLKGARKIKADDLNLKK